MIGIVENCVQDFLEKCESHSAAQQEFDAKKLAQCLTMDVIDQCAISMNLQCIKNPDVRY